MYITIVRIQKSGEPHASKQPSNLASSTSKAGFGVR